MPGGKPCLKERSHPELSHSFKLGLVLGVVVVWKREVRAELLKLFSQFSEQLREDFSSQLQRYNSQSP